MSEMKFSRNYNDCSISHGTGAGFQFEFYCERCNDTWRSSFTPYRSAQASEWIGKAAGFFGGLLGGAGQMVDGVAKAGWGEARDEEFSKALDQAKHHFHRCAKCQNYVCAACWNTHNGLCLECAPSAEVEIESARAQGMMEKAGERAREAGQKQAEKLDVLQERQLVCPQCKTETKGAKFCPECGFNVMSTRLTCPSCGADAKGAKFCPECGTKMLK